MLKNLLKFFKSKKYALVFAEYKVKVYERSSVSANENISNDLKKKLSDLRLNIYFKQVFPI